MAQATTKLDAQDQVILFCAATGIDHAALGILPHAMRSMAIRALRFIATLIQARCGKSRPATLRWIGPFSQ
jgi:hypothetical protein